MMFDTLILFTVRRLRFKHFTTAVSGGDKRRRDDHGGGQMTTTAIIRAQALPATILQGVEYGPDDERRSGAEGDGMH
jgi:hypothetical protein